MKHPFRLTKLALPACALCLAGNVAAIEIGPADNGLQVVGDNGLPVSGADVSIIKADGTITRSGLTSSNGYLCIVGETGAAVGHQPGLHHPARWPLPAVRRHRTPGGPQPVRRQGGVRRRGGARTGDRRRGHEHRGTNRPDRRWCPGGWRRRRRRWWRRRRGRRRSTAAG